MGRLRLNWPIRLTSGPLTLQPLRLRDEGAWRNLRRVNADWLRPWDATLPAHDPAVPHTFRALVRETNREARAGRSLAMAIWWEGRLVGQVTVGGIVWSALRSAHIGYWIDRGHAGRGITPLAVAVLGDYCWRELNLHRIEIAIRPENQASLRVVEKLGFRHEGQRPGYLHIDGDWRDHLVYALNAEECPEGLQARLRDCQGSGTRPTDRLN